RTQRSDKKLLRCRFKEKKRARPASVLSVFRHPYGWPVGATNRWRTSLFGECCFPTGEISWYRGVERGKIWRRKYPAFPEVCIKGDLL
ncbi:MAG: hypothetical protein ABIH04_08695, partial [Planctomycetota bacterium]